MVRRSTSLADLIADLGAEHDALDAVVAPLDDEGWRMPTPSPGWSTHHQIAHLAFFDGTATTAIVEPDRFTAETKVLMDEMMAGADMDSLTLGWATDLSPSDLYARWQENQATLLEAAGDLADDVRVPWYGPSMGAKSFVTARLMETWAHGHDVVDAVGTRVAVERPPTDRLRHIAQLGVITRSWTYINRGMEPPADAVAVRLTAPSGDEWTWHDDATQSVSGPAEDFCLVVTQRRHVDDTALTCDGDAARDWMERAQAFAGGATHGPSPAS